MKKDQRNINYKIALELLKEGKYSFMCPCLSSASGMPIEEIGENFPELYKFKPDYIKSSLVPWFDIEQSDKENRITILEKCIEMTK